MVSENDVVWITLQARQFNWKRVTITKVEGDDSNLMPIFYTNTNHRETFLKIDTVQDKEKTTTDVPIVVMVPAIIGQFFCGEGKRYGSCTQL